MIDNKETEKVIEIAKIDGKIAIQMSNKLIQRITNAQQCSCSGSQKAAPAEEHR